MRQGTQDTKEVWRDVVGLEEFYQVSSKGRVRAKPKREFCHQCKNVTVRPSFVVKELQYANGYAKVPLRVGLNKQKFARAHRLVAEAFIPNQNQKPYVNHKDFNRMNNSVENLEWVTHLENMEYSRTRGRWKKAA